MDISPQVFALSIISICNFFLGIFVLARKPRHIMHRAFFIAMMGIFIWGTGLILITTTRNFAFNPLTIYGFSIFLLGFVLFARVFPNRETIRNKFWYIFIPLVFVGAVAPTNLIIESARYHGNQPEAVNGPLFPVFAIVLVFYFLVGLWFFRNTYKKSQGIERLRMNYLLFGLIVFIACTALFDVVLPILGIFELNFLGPISSIILTGSTAYAIIRHQLMDIRVVLQRGLIYAILFAILTGLYMIGLFTIGWVLHAVTDTAAIVSAGITMVLGVFFAQPLNRYFKRVTDPFFFKDSYDYARSLYRLSHVLYTTLNQKDIVDNCIPILKEIFRTTDVRFDLEADAVTKLTESDRSAGFKTITIPIVFENKNIGTLCLGHKLSGDAYTEQDAQLISTFAFQAAISFGKARLYEKVEEYSTHLEQLVEERTRELKKLQEDQKQAMIDISHNLQTPLAVIKGELELLGESSHEPEKLQAVRKSLTRVSQFIRQLLHLARLDNSIYNITLTELDLSRLVHDQVEYFEVMAGEKNISITSEITSHIKILGDRKLIQELITNIVINSIKYRRARTKSVIQITLRKQDNTAVLSINDNGIGIDAKNLEGIFTRFYRVSEEKSRAAGTGLGLAIAKKIVEQHMGTIAAESIPGEGTTFTITMPML